MVMTQRTVRRFLQLFTFQEFNTPHTSGRTQMIHDGIGFVESLRRNDVFVGDAFVLVGRRRAVAMKPDVMFSWNLTKSLIKRHVFLPLGCHPERSRRISRHSQRKRAQRIVRDVSVRAGLAFSLNMTVLGYKLPRRSCSFSNA